MEELTRKIEQNSNMVTSQVYDKTDPRYEVSLEEGGYYSGERSTKYPCRERTFMVIKKWPQLVREYNKYTDGSERAQIIKKHIYFIAYVSERANRSPDIFQRFAMSGQNDVLSCAPIEYDIIEVDGSVRPEFKSLYDEYFNKVLCDMQGRPDRKLVFNKQVAPGRFTDATAAEALPPEVYAFLMVRAGLQKGLLGDAAKRWIDYMKTCESGEWMYEQYGPSFGDSDCVVIKGYKGSDRTLRIPSFIDGKRVVALDFDGVGTGYERVNKVIIPQSVKYICEKCFWGWENLRTVEMEEGVRYIGACAFEFCEKLDGVTLPGSVTMIDKGAFQKINEKTKFIAPADSYADWYADMLGYKIKRK